MVAAACEPQVYSAHQLNLLATEHGLQCRCTGTEATSTQAGASKSAEQTTGSRVDRCVLMLV